MNTEDILKKVRRIEIKAKRLSQDVFAGQYRHANAMLCLLSGVM